MRAKHTARLPWIQASLLYGSGLRLMECARLRVKDINFDQRRITVREGKGGKDRATVLPDKVATALGKHLEGVRLLHQRDIILATCRY